MKNDRRESLRRKVELPFAWQPMVEPADWARLCKLFAVPPILELEDQLGELESEYLAARRKVDDGGVLCALDLLHGRLKTLQSAVLGDVPEPAATTIELSASGISFPTAEEVSSAWLALHLVLPDQQHVLCAARTVRSVRRQRDWCTAAELHGLKAAPARALTRFVTNNS